MTSPVDYKHVSILWASPEHAAELAELHARLFPKAWDGPSFQRLLAHPGSTSFLARVGQPPKSKAETVGFILGQLAADEAEILTLGVRADRQRHGIARRLVEALARAARKAEARRLHLEVGRNNAPALALYKKLGFQESGRRKGYYEQPGSPAEDAVALTLVLAD
jgi:ribosomal-protein-alanine N-acetyltransferase